MEQKSLNEKIDFVVAWVDGNDPVWRNEMFKYVPEEMRKREDSAGDDRYVDNGLFRFWFRSIEKFAPWVNKIFFITYGHLPEWLDTSNPKLVIVNHKDYMPQEYLPTFNFVPLALNLHRIKGLSEHFVLFNDDMYLTSPCDKKVFFKKGLPCDMAVQDGLLADRFDMYNYMLFNAMCIINKNYRKKDIIRKNKSKWFNLKYGKNFVKNLLLSKISLFTGFYSTHMPQSYLKSMFEKVWEDNPKELDQSSRNKFRYYNDITEEIVQYYQFVEGKFSPVNRNKMGRYLTMTNGRLPKIIISGKYKYICINSNADGEVLGRAKKAFETILPDKSSFEL